METLTKNRPEAQPEPEKPVDQLLEDIKNQCLAKGGFFDDIDDPWAKTEIDFASRSVEDLNQQTLQKIEQKLEPASSGWYEQKFTGDRFHLQFYDDPDQARTEFIANSIYRHLGLKAPETELVEIDGRLGLASAEIVGAEIVNCQEQRLSTDVRAGFVADAYLANTDVIGINYDNVVAGPGGLYRASAAGALDFAANGQPKDYRPDQIPELKTMLDSNFTAGQIFAGTFDGEIASQARQLVSRLDTATIDSILADSGVSGPRAENIRAGLVGRRQFLADRFVDHKEPGPRRDCRLGRTVDSLDTKEVRLRPETGQKLRAYEAFLSDGDHIEAQTVNLIDCRADRGCLELKFKLATKHQKQTLQRVIADNHDHLRLGSIYYQSTDDYRSIAHICDAIEIDRDGLTVQLAIDPQTKEEITLDYDYDNYESPAMSTSGLVNIEIPCPNSQSYPDLKQAAERLKQDLGLEFNIAEPDFAQIEDQVNEVLVDLLGIPGGLTEPDAAAERQHKIDRWGWHHKLNPAQLEPQQLAAAESLQRREVSPGCWAMVEGGKHQKYQEKYGQFAFFHKLREPETLISILGAESLMSSHRRYSLGVQFEGMSTMEDFQTGGADSAFTRLIVEGQNPPDPESVRLAQFLHNLECILVLNPNLADRTDYYAYPKDKFGSTRAGDLAERQSPDEMFAAQIEGGYPPANEQMFAGGISAQAFEKVAFAYQSQPRRQLTEALMTKIIPDQKQREAAFDEGPKAVQARLEQAFGLADPVDSLWEAGPQVLADFLAQNDIDEIFCDVHQAGGSVQRWYLEVDEWLYKNQRMRLIQNLAEAGIEQINGQPLAQFVTEADNHYDFIDLAQGQPPRSKANRPSSYQEIPELYDLAEPPPLSDDLNQLIDSIAAD